MVVSKGIWSLGDDSLALPVLTRIICDGALKWVNDGDFSAFKNMTYMLYMLLFPLLKSDKNFVDRYSQLKKDFENGRIKEEKFYFRLFELISTFLAIHGILWKVLLSYRESLRMEEDSELNFFLDYLTKTKTGEVYDEI